jgi:DNA-binding NarL/FixJ family response regulator
VNPAQNRTLTVLCADVAPAGRGEWLIELGRARGGLVVNADRVGRVEWSSVAFDSATAAVAAAVEMQRVATSAPDGTSVRIGLATGDVVVLDAGCAGVAVNTAAGLLVRAAPGQILANNVVRWLASSAAAHGYVSIGVVEIDGLAEPVEAFVVDWQPIDEVVKIVDSSGPPLAPLPAGIAAAVRQPLVGRHAEWQLLDEAWSRVREGSREVVLIGGEAGAGKTRLAADFARRCHEAGATVLLGSCDAELALPYQPWVHALDHLLRSLPGFGRPQNSDRDLGDLLVLLPQLERLLPGLSRSPAADPETERYLLFSAVDRVLANAAQSAPMVVLLDDLHWAGRPTLELLRHLVRAGSAASLMIIATFRDAAADLTDPLAECLVDLQRSESVNRVRLGGLDAISVEQFVAGALGQELDGDLRRLAAVARDRSGGNAFFLGELWRQLVQQGVIAREDDRWVVRRDVAGVGAPDSVRDVVAARMARLSRRARRPVELAAVAGQRVELRVLSLAAEMDVDDVTAGLEELVDTGFLVEVGGHLPTYQFTHALVRDTVEQVMSLPGRARLHLRIAEALEQVYEADPRSVYAELAYHFSAATAVGGSERGIRYGRLAAEQARSSVAYDEAISQFEAVLQLLPAESVEATEVLIDLGLVQMRRGFSSTAQDTYQRAFDTARRESWAELVADAALGYEECVHQRGAPGGPAVRMVSEAIGLIGDQPGPLRARLQASLARSLSLSGDHHAAAAAGELALAMARAVGDLGCVVAALQATTIVSSEPSWLVEAGTELRDVSLQIGDQWSAVYATGNICRGLMELGRLGEAAEVLVQHRLMAERGRFLMFQYMGHVYEAALALAAGRFGEAEQAAERAHEIGNSSDIVFDAGVYGLQMFAIRREQGRLPEVLPFMRFLSEHHGAEAVWRPGLTVLYAELGMLEESTGELDALSPDGFASIPRDSVWPACLTFLAEACIACGDPKHAAVLLRELDHYAGRNLMVAMTICFGPADRLRGGLARLVGLANEAEGHFRAALALADRSASPLWRAHVQLDWAGLAADRGDLAKAEAMAGEAHAGAVALGMNALAERAASLLGRFAAPSPPLGDSEGLSHRELEVLRLIAEGCSNREIGERLFISQHTAANHVRSILQKLGCGNRAEAAVYAVHRRLIGQPQTN